MRWQMACTWLLKAAQRLTARPESALEGANPGLLDLRRPHRSVRFGEIQQPARGKNDRAATPGPGDS